MKLEDNVFNDLPLLLAVPRAAQLLGISRAAAYRLVAPESCRFAGSAAASTW
jgi:predicted DNA-binding transcriptional regulator AlpA